MLARLERSLKFARKYCAVQEEVSYVYHRSVKTLYADKQAYLLTKTLRVQNRPPSVEKLLQSIDAKDMVAPFEKAILEAKGFEAQGEFVKTRIGKRKKRKTQPQYRFALMQNFLRAIGCAYSKQYPHLSELFIGDKPFITSTWERYGSRVTVHGKQASFLMSKKPLPRIFDHTTVEESAKIQLESTHPNPPFFDLAETKEELPQTYLSGFTGTPPFPHLHTMLLVDLYSWPAEQIIQKALLHLFTHLVTDLTQRQGKKFGEVLEKPVPAQAIIACGKRFHFIWYQLNTLDLKDDDGIKNLVYIENPGWMYKKILSDKETNAKSLTNMEEEPVKLFMTQLFAKPT